MKVLFGGLAISFPIFGHMLAFSFMIAQVSCSAALTIFSYLLAVHGKNIFTRWVLPVLLCAFSLFTYQSLIYIIPALYFTDLLIGDGPLFAKSNFAYLPRLILICCSAIAAYFVGSHFLHIITGIPKSGYLETMAIYLREPFMIALKDIAAYLKALLRSEHLSALNFICVPVAILLASGKYRLSRLIILLAIMIYSLLPFFGLGLLLPMRAWWFVPVLFAGIFCAAITRLKKGARIAFFAFGIWIILFNSSINTRLSMLDYFAAQRDQLIASRIYNELCDISPNYLHNVRKSVVLGTIKMDNPLPKVMDGVREVHGGSFFSWFGEVGRVYSYLDCLGVQLPPSVNSTNAYREIISLDSVRQMPYYPEKGFIRIVGDVLVIKLAQPPA